MNSLHQLLADLVAIWLGKLLKRKKNKVAGNNWPLMGLGLGRKHKPIEYYKKSFLLLQPYPGATKHCISKKHVSEAVNKTAQYLKFSCIFGGIHIYC